MLLVNKKITFLVLVGVVITTLTACEKEETFQKHLEKASFLDTPFWQKDDLQQAYTAFEYSCKSWKFKKPDQLLKPDSQQADLFGTYKNWQDICQKLKSVSKSNFKEFLQQNLQPYKVVSLQGSLFTGYYAPHLKGSKTPRKGYETPLYNYPNNIFSLDLGEFLPEMKGQKLYGRIQGKKFIPYAERAEIDAQKAFDHAKPFIWLKDPVEAFFLHIQGSGWVETPEGEVIHVSYAGNNGHPYTSIGKVLIEKGYMKKEDVSLESLKVWLKENPAKREEVFNKNPRYIFFKQDKGETVGSLSVPLTAGRSLAVDPSFIPLGVPLLVSTTLTSENKPYTRLMMAQDTGAAITGPVRGDIFFGDGKAAEKQAGMQNAPGEMFVLLPK